MHLSRVDIIVANVGLSDSSGVQISRKKSKPRSVASSFLLFSSVWSPLMKHDKRVFKLASQICIPIDLLYVSLIHLNMKTKKYD